MITQYKTHIWSKTEYRNGTILHAPPSQLARIDAMQRGFLKELHISEDDAFLNFNFAPPVLRRDIGILGLLHKRVLGLAHVSFEELFPFRHDNLMGHDKQIETSFHLITCRPALFFRSIFAMAMVYNRLPQWLIDFKTISSFQANLTGIAKNRCRLGIDDWQFSFHDCDNVLHYFLDSS